jgi:hypothetical protein
MLPLTLVSAFPAEAGLLAAGTLATPTGLDGDLAAFLGGMICNRNKRRATASFDENSAAATRWAMEREGGQQRHS